jgi:hypothetical protein
MYTLRADALNLKSSFVAYGETKSEVIAKMFTYLQNRHPDYLGQPTIQRLGELDELMNKHIEEENY